MMFQEIKEVLLCMEEGVSYFSNNWGFSSFKMHVKIINNVCLKPLHNIGKTKNKNVHIFTHNLHGIKITMVESFLLNISAWCVIVFD